MTPRTWETMLADPTVKAALTLSYFVVRDATAGEPGGLTEQSRRLAGAVGALDSDGALTATGEGLLGLFERLFEPAPTPEPPAPVGGA